MTLIYLKRAKIQYRLSVLALLVACVAMPGIMHAQALTLSVSPTLFEMSANPSQTWSSSVKVINNNKHPLTVYANVVNFAPQGETGHGKFIPLFETFTEGSTLGEWITLSTDSVTLAPETSQQIPFVIEVPEDASPGGHFAAILIGTKPPKSDEPFQVKTSQIVTSLFFVRVSGDVVESGSVREFRVVDSFVDTPSADFEFRFQNDGNVHLQPQGEILITNMWGKERGIIPINHKTHFGNVLPDSIRKFDFSWKGEQSFSDIGRYKAILTLGYGVDSRHFATSTEYFWVIPIKAVLTVLLSLAFFIWFMSWCIRAYVRRMLSLSGMEVQGGYQPPRARNFAKEGDVLIQKRMKVSAPVRSGFTDLRTRLASVTAFFDIVRTLIGFVASYRLFFGGALVLIVAIVTFVYYFNEVTETQRDYEVVIDSAGQDVKLSSEDILYDRTKEPERVPNTVVSEDTELAEQPYELSLVNAGDTPGVAAGMRIQLEELGYTVDSLSSDFGDSKERTVIVYDTDLSEEALELSQHLGNALLSARVTSDSADAKNITVFIGNDYKTE